MPLLKFAAFSARLRPHASPTGMFRLSLNAASGMRLIAGSRRPAYPRVTNSNKGTAPINYNGAANVDDDLRQRVLVALSSGSVGTQGILPSDQLTDIKVNVTNRVVTLNGDVDSEKSKTTIAKRVAGLNGVKGVNNNLMVSAQRKPAHKDLTAPDGYSAGKKEKMRVTRTANALIRPRISSPFTRRK